MNKFEQEYKYLKNVTDVQETNLKQTKEVCDFLNKIITEKVKFIDHELNHIKYVHFNEKIPFPARFFKPKISSSLNVERKQLQEKDFMQRKTLEIYKQEILLRKKLLSFDKFLKYLPNYLQRTSPDHLVRILICLEDVFGDYEKFSIVKKNYRDYVSKIITWEELISYVKLLQ